jgi:hypothetical protein
VSKQPVKTNIICLALIAIGLWAMSKFAPGPGDADARGQARTVEKWPWE